MKNPLYVSIINSKGPYPDLARAWVRRALDAGVSNYIIFCADEESFKELSSDGITVRRIKAKDHTVPPHYLRPPGAFGAIPFLKLVILEELLEEGVPLVYSDVDAFIQKDPADPIKDLLSLHDVLLSTVNHSNAYPKRARDRWKFSLCSGWMAFQGTPSSYKFIQELKKLKGKNLQLNLNNYVLNRATLQKGDSNASFQIEGVGFKLLDQSFVSRSEFPIDSYIYHCLGPASECLNRIKDNDKP